MNINKTIYCNLSVIMCVAGLLMSGCNDDFLNRTPETSITERNFFKSDQDLELYSNRFYGYFYTSCFAGINLSDSPSDNVVCSNTTDGLYNYLSGAINPNTVGKWGWGDIRDVNFMISRANNASGTNVSHFKGMARLTRALLYYNKVVVYSDVPWYSRDLQTNDNDLLYKAQDSRAVVCDSIMNDLNYAITNMKTASQMGSNTYITRDVALALKARICLAEASWRKYHPELGLNDADKFYEYAISACKELMGMGYSLSSNYMDLFRNTTLSGNKEAILYIDYDRANNIMWSYNDSFIGANGGLSKDLFDTYLYIKDGKAVPYTSISGYETNSYADGFINRDPRLSLTFMYPGWKRPSEADHNYVPYLTSFIGYPQIKWEPMYDGGNTNGYSAGNVCFGDVAKYRYAEILLIYAEAKAELGQLTQEDLDISINLLRKRVGMPTATLSEWLANTDPVLETKYPNVASAQKGAILEIRRERRIELEGEGFREADLFRWALGSEFEDQGKGIYVGVDLPASVDYDGDGTSDVVIVASISDKASYSGPGVPYVVQVDNFLISSDGYLKPADKEGIYKFDAPKYYYTPISSQDILLNPNLKQNPNWK